MERFLRVWTVKRFMGISKHKRDADINDIVPLGICLEKQLKKMGLCGIMSL